MSYTCWGVELHESVVSNVFAKEPLVGRVQELPCSNGHVRVAEQSYVVPQFADLTAFVDKLSNDDMVSVQANYQKTGRYSIRTRQRIMKKTTGLSATQIKHIRLAEQAILLLESGQTITHVAAELGFADQSHLTKLIKHTTAKTPGYFLRNH